MVRHASPEPDVGLAILVAMLILFGIPFFLYALGGLFTVQPRTQVVVMRWGKPRYIVKEAGISYAFPLGRELLRVTSSMISLDLPKMMVLEANGSPIEVSGVCSYRVVDAKKALLEVEGMSNYVSLLASAVLKNVCAHYPYETPDPNKPCLRKENDVITKHLVGDLQALVEPAGVEILQMRINDLTYAPEVAQSMLLRQQAVAMVEARRTIVEGAVWTVSSAQEKMRAAGLGLDAEALESLAHNLMLVLCSGERVQTFMPVEVMVGGRQGRRAMGDIIGAVLGLGFVGLLVLLIVYAASTFTVRPREAHVMLYWGKYRRTITKPGFHTAFPFGLSRRVVSTRDVAVGTPITTVVEAHGSPIQVSAVVVYKVEDAAKALIDVQGYQAYVVTQASTVVKTVCSRFPYESTNPEEPSLKKESHEIIEALQTTLQGQVSAGGVKILLVRLNDLTYAPEIAQSMLLRQQAQAMVDARRTVVEGAVATVKDGLDRLEAAGFKLAPDKRARLASNLTLLLCAGERGEQHSTVIARQRR